MTEGGNGRGVRVDGPLRLPRCEVFRKLQIDRGSSRCSVDGRRGTPRIRRSTARCPRRAASGPEAQGRSTFEVSEEAVSGAGRSGVVGLRLHRVQRRLRTADRLGGGVVGTDGLEGPHRGSTRGCPREPRARRFERGPRGTSVPDSGRLRGEQALRWARRSGARGALGRSVESASSGPVRRPVRRPVRGSRRETIRVRRRVWGPPVLAAFNFR